jgi:hypothetical protein
MTRRRKNRSSADRGCRAQPSASRRQTSDDFASVARRLECDEDKGRFEANLAKIAKVKPARAKE